MKFLELCLMAIAGTFVISFCIIVLGTAVKAVLKNKGE